MAMTASNKRWSAWCINHCLGPFFRNNANNDTSYTQQALHEHRLSTQLHSKKKHPAIARRACSPLCLHESAGNAYTVLQTHGSM